MTHNVAADGYAGTTDESAAHLRTSDLEIELELVSWKKVGVSCGTINVRKNVCQWHVHACSCLSFAGYCGGGYVAGYQADGQG